MTRMPDKPIPIGCLVGLFALFAGIFAGTAFWGAARAFAKEPPAAEIGNKLILWGIIASIPAMIGLAFCIFRIANSGKRKYRRIGSSLSS